MKTTYDVFANTNGILTRWSEGTFEKLAAVSMNEFDPKDYIVIETPSCFLRFKKDLYSNEASTEYIRSFFAVYRVHPSPRYKCRVQYCKKPGQWINHKLFDTPEKAREFVAEQNKRLEPFADSPFNVNPSDETKKVPTNAIGAARAAKGLTQQQLADILGWTLRKLTSYERGERVPPLSEALRLATVLGVPVEGLWILE